MSEPKKNLSILEKMKQKAMKQVIYGGEIEDQETQMKAHTCGGCGAGRTKEDGLTHCAYCGYEFISVILTDGIHIKKTDNSKKF